MNGDNYPLYDVLQEALRAAVNAPVTSPSRDRLTGDGQELEILFYGMMCFDPLPGRSGYRVLFPNGLDLTALTEIPVHTAGMWVRDRSARVTARWSGPVLRNDFFVDGKRQLTITGLARTPLVTTEFEGRVANLQNCDPEFKISDNPDAVIDMIVDRGTLSAHVVNGAGLIVVRWAVKVEDGGPVRFTFGSDFVEVPANVTQVILANVSAMSQTENFRDFQLFRKLSTYPNRPLPFQPPRTMPTAFIELQEPTFGYTPAALTPTPDPARRVPVPTPGGVPGIVGVVPASTLDAIAQTPHIVCSPAVSGPRDGA